MAKSGEKSVKNYLERKGLQVEKIPESDAKTVDFAVYSEKGLAFYLEEKTLEPASLEWKKTDPVYNSISRHVHEAVKQFKSVNPGRTVPNVLAVTNLDPGRDVNVLFAALTGQALTRSGKMIKLNKFGGDEKDRSLIDLYLWFDGGQLAGYIWEDNAEPCYEGELTKLLGL